MKHLIFGLVIVIIVSLILCLLHVRGEFLLFSILFNFLFVSALFPLNGLLKRKMVLLLAGNFISFLWNKIFYLFAFFSAEHFGGIFSILLLILSPFLNLFLIVSFYSVSLTFISPSKRKRGGITDVY